MKKFLVDVPVMLNVWIRPHIQKRTFASVKRARPSKLFLISDGPRNDDERRKIQESRAIVEDIDWDCEVYKLYFEENQGMYATIFNELDFVFSHVDRCILLEDDVLPSVSFFRFCADLLERYKDDYRITAINGTNYYGKYRDEESDYFFTHGNSIIGMAFWKRTYDLFKDDVFKDKGLLCELENYVKESPRDFIANAVFNSTKAHFRDINCEGHPPAVEFYRSFLNVTQSQLDIVPTVNLVTNLGAGNDSTHICEYKLMPRRMQRLFLQKRYELQFPLRHPRYIIRDKTYENYLRIGSIGRMGDTIERLVKTTMYLSPEEFIEKVKHKLIKKRVIKNSEK